MRSAPSRSSPTSPGVADTIDPLAGSYYVERLTDVIEAAAGDYLRRIDEMGGAVAAIEAGFQRGEIEDVAYRHLKLVESGERVIVGVNAFESDAEERIQLQAIPSDAAQRQLDRLDRVRNERDATAVDAALSTPDRRRPDRRQSPSPHPRMRRELRHPRRDLRRPPGRLRHVRPACLILGSPLSPYVCGKYRSPLTHPNHAPTMRLQLNHRSVGPVVPYAVSATSSGGYVLALGRA